MTYVFYDKRNFVTIRNLRISTQRRFIIQSNFLFFFRILFLNHDVSLPLVSHRCPHLIHVHRWTEFTSSKRCSSPTSVETWLGEFDKFASVTRLVYAIRGRHECIIRETGFTAIDRREKTGGGRNLNSVVN